MIIVKRLPRFDRSSNDIINIKSKISVFANQVYDQLWLKSGSPTRIHIIDIQLFENGGYLKDLIFGTHENLRFDGIHLIGSGASRHFTYRAIQALAPIISKPNQHQKQPSFWRQGRTVVDRAAEKDNHQDCPQAAYMRQSAGSRLRGRLDSSYSDALKGSSQQKTNYAYTVPTKNFFNPLNC